METIQNNIRQYRKLKGFTQWHVAKHLGLSSIDRISKWEHGKQYPHVVNLLMMAKLFGCHAEELYKS